ncbi:hypothetical protein DCAR_0208812 [Daucus carota subsp. sativus]|uniref:Uncharacterized protein n=1 Tax=Daucus carota subsp. sativus TaxID=79200 RepID=A0A166ETP1_DAUCS|nr:hypothetical protein DCAR_0208812 [Daucus carota subsp. sativus]
MASHCSSTLLKALFLLSFLVATALIGMSEARQLNENVAHITQTSDSPPSFPNIPFLPPFPTLPKFPQIPGLPPCPLPTLPFPFSSGGTPPPGK